jgi:hypothetical protein
MHKRMIELFSIILLFAMCNNGISKKQKSQIRSDTMSFVGKRKFNVFCPGYFSFDTSFIDTMHLISWGDSVEFDFKDASYGFQRDYPLHWHGYVFRKTSGDDRYITDYSSSNFKYVILFMLYHSIGNTMHEGDSIYSARIIIDSGNSITDSNQFYGHLIKK